MEIPTSGKVYETPASTYWYVGEVLYAVAKDVQGISLEEIKKYSEEFIKSLKGKKVFAIMEINNPTSKEARDFNSQQLSKMFKAIAFIAKTPLAKVLANIYIGTEKLSFPTKVFSNQKDAENWIRGLNK